MIIELKGVEFENKGAELMLRAILERIHAYWPDAQIAMTPGPKASYLERTSVGAWQKLSLRKSYLDLNGLCGYIPAPIRRYMKRWGVVLESDIDVIIDASGFSYSDQWGSDLRIRHAAAEARRLAARGKAYLFMPQAMGPFKAERTQKLIAEGFPHAALVCARDDDTWQHLKNAAGEFASLRQVKDFTNAVKGTVPDYFTDGERKMCIIPNKNMINPRNKNQGWLNRYIDTLVLFAQLSEQQGLTPFFLNHEGKEDGAVIEQALARLGKPYEVITESDPVKVKGIIQASRISLCSRYHGCISALSSGKPCIGTSWSHKYERLYEEYSATSLLITPDMTEQKMSEVLALALNEHSDIQQQIRERALQFKQETEQFWSEVKSIVDSVRHNV